MIAAKHARTRSSNGNPFVVGVSAVDPSLTAAFAGRGEPHDLLAIVADLCDELVMRHDGRAIGTIDETRLSIFSDPHGSLKYAIDVQRAAGGAHNRRTGGVSVRIGIGTGRVAARGAAASEEGVELALAVADLAEAGGICLTRECLDALGPDLGVGCTFMMEMQVPGRSERVRVYRVSLDTAEAGRILDGRIGLWDEQDP